MTETAGREEWAVWGECQQDNYRLAPRGHVRRKTAKIKKKLWRSDEFAGRANDEARMVNDECEESEFQKYVIRHSEFVIGCSPLLSPHVSSPRTPAPSRP